MISVAGRKIALIGGAGFIGHNLAMALNQEGAEVHVIDSLQVNNLLSFMPNGTPGVSKDLYLRMIHERLELLHQQGNQLHIQDARDYHALSRILSSIKPQVVIHLAAVAHAGKSNKDPFSTFDHSLRTLENALDWSRDNVEHFIYFSSSMVYGNFASGVVDEASICEPLGIYGALKFAGEKMVIAYQQVFNLPYTIIRPSALYGERCVSRRVIQIFIENAMEGLEVRVDGDGSECLDYTYIDDLVLGIRKIIENEKSRNQVLNITYGQGRSINELIEVVKSYYPALKVRYSPKDTLMPNRGTLSVDKAKKLIDYQPQYSLEKGFQKYIEWYKSIFSHT